MRAPRPRALLVTAALVLAVLAGCGGDDGEPSAQDCREVAPSDDGVTRATVVGRNIQFDVSCLRVRPGPLELTFDNRDGGVAHNLRVTGQGVDAATELESGTATQVLELDLAPGRYRYVCDPHGNMEGTLVVEEPSAGTTTTAAP